jgi:PST family polysaccharide transporter
LAIAGMAVVLYMKIDQVMLGEMLGDRDVGLYSAAIRLSEVWYFIPVSIVTSVSPSLFEAKKISAALYYQRLGRLSRLVALIALAIAVPMTFASGYLMTTLYGSEYKDAGTVLAVHIWAALFVFLGVAQNPWTVSEGLTKLALLRTSLGAAANIFLNLLLIPTYGPTGAAIATTVSYALSAVILNALSPKTRMIFTLQLSSMIPVRLGSR